MWDFWWAARPSSMTKAPAVKCDFRSSELRCGAPLRVGAYYIRASGASGAARVPSRPAGRAVAGPTQRMPSRVARGHRVAQRTHPPLIQRRRKRQNARRECLCAALQRDRLAVDLEVGGATIFRPEMR